MAGTRKPAGLGLLQTRPSRSLVVLVLVSGLLLWSFFASTRLAGGRREPTPPRTHDASELRIHFASANYGVKWRPRHESTCLMPGGETVRLLVDAFDDEGARTADALLYYARGVQNAYDSWFFSRKYVNVWPEEATPDQVLVLYTEESQQYDTWQNDLELVTLFHVLKSMDPRPQPAALPSNFGVLTFMHRYNTGLLADLPRMADKRSGQEGLLAWVASNCNAHSNRLGYLQAIAEHVAVHSMGKCWNTRTMADLPFSGLSSDALEAERVLVGREYKFWYAAENFVCSNYVTEKMFMPLAYGSVPVVYGGSSHALYAPSADSFVDARDFPSAKALAARLAYLDRNDTAYLELHAWRTRPWSELNQNFTDLVHRMERDPDQVRDPSRKGESHLCSLARRVREVQQATARPHVEGHSCTHSRGLIFENSHEWEPPV